VPPSLIVVIPAFDEAENLPGVLAALAEVALGAEVVVVDDGSRDETAAVAARHGARVLSHPFNLGYGAAVQTGYKYALERGAELLVQLDADGQHDPREIPRLVDPVRRGECDLALGSRFVEESGYEMGRLKSRGRKLLEWLGARAGVHVTDPTTGFQAMNRATLELFAQDFFPPDYPDVDVLVVAARSGLRVREYPSRMRESPRPSTLHGGRRMVYYAYKMLLSLWAASGSRS
jgi:glycosyltransferase involved in cell wall biosynthesis